MAKTYHAAGFAVVIDDFFDPYPHMREYGKLFARDEMKRVVLYPSQQKAYDQNLRRPPRAPTGISGQRDQTHLWRVESRGRRPRAGRLERMVHSLDSEMIRPKLNTETA